MVGNDGGSPDYPQTPAVRRYTDGTEPICETLGEVRACLDLIDGNIAGWLALRAHFASDGGRFKDDRNRVDSPERERQVTNNIVQTATALNPEAADLAKRAAETIVSASKDLQRLKLRRSEAVDNPHSRESFDG